MLKTNLNQPPINNHLESLISADYFADILERITEPLDFHTLDQNTLLRDHFTLFLFIHHNIKLHFSDNSTKSYSEFSEFEKSNFKTILENCLTLIFISDNLQKNNTH